MHYLLFILVIFQHVESVTKLSRIREVHEPANYSVLSSTCVFPFKCLVSFPSRSLACVLYFQNVFGNTKFYDTLYAQPLCSTLASPSLFHIVHCWYMLTCVCHHVIAGDVTLVYSKLSFNVGLCIWMRSFSLPFCLNTICSMACTFSNFWNCRFHHSCHKFLVPLFQLDSV